MKDSLEPYRVIKKEVWARLHKQIENQSKMKKIKQLYISDLMYLADSLPELPYFDHRKNVITAFQNGEWKLVDEYVDYVTRVHMELYVIKPNKTLREHIYQRVAYYTNRILTWFKTIV